MAKHQIKRENNENMAIVSSRYPRAKIFLEHESSQQTVNIRSTNAIHAKEGYVPIAYAPQESTGVQNVWLSSCMYRKQSFNTRLNSVAQNRKKWHANDHQ